MVGVRKYNDSDRVWGTRSLGRWLELARQGMAGGGKRRLRIRREACECDGDLCRSTDKKYANTTGTLRAFSRGTCAFSAVGAHQEEARRA